MTRTLPFIVLATACAGSTEPTEPPEIRSGLPRNTAPQVSAAQLAELVDGNTAFALDLYREVRSEPGNLFMSPHSISTALAMTYAGAATETAAQMAATLHYTLPAPELHAAFNALDLALASRAAAASGDTIPFRLRTANSMWGRKDAHFESAFLDTLAVDYDAGMRVLDFGADPEGARKTINGWVEDQTNDKIKNLLPQGVIEPSTRLVLTNAIYFSAAWAEPFRVSDTADRPFHTTSGTVQVPTLQQAAQHRYMAGDGFAAAELRYDGNQLSMVVVAPDDLAAFEAGLNPGVLAQIDAGLQVHMLELSLPKFRFDAPLGLKQVLYALGMTDAFTDGAADFSGIDGTRDLVITDVLHKGFVAIDEKGTEAAAATAVVIGPTSVPQPATLVVDKPFLFFIRDLPTGAILFVGRVVDPR
jgi:serpin B